MFVISLLVIWHMGTEFPYADRNIAAQWLNSIASQGELKWNAYYNTKWAAANKIVNPPRPCIACYIATHQMLLVRRNALELQAKAEDYEAHQGNLKTR